MLVSCVMATNRRRAAFIRAAVRNFQAQTLGPRELVVVVDEGDDVHDLMPEGVRYIFSPEKIPIWRKMQLGFAAAEGLYLNSWDDDDYQPPHALAVKIEAILRSPKKAWRAGCAHHLYQDLRDGRMYRLTRAGDTMLTFGSMLFDRKVLDHVPIPQDGPGWDWRFQQRLQVLGPTPDLGPQADTLYVAMIHSANDWATTADLSQPHWRPDARTLEQVCPIADEYRAAFRAQQSANPHPESPQVPRGEVP